MLITSHLPISPPDFNSLPIEILPPPTYKFLTSSNSEETFSDLNSRCFQHLRTEDQKVLCELIKSMIAPLTSYDEQISSLISPQLKSHFITSFLLLPSSRIIEEEDFLDNPLFKNTKEKKAVFEKLIEITKDSSFEKTYENFLFSLKSDSWVEPCREYHILYTYLSIIAYFNGDIDQEEMFVIHAVCTAYNDLENHSNKPESSVRVIQVVPKVISPEDISGYLTKGNFPPFAENTPKNMLTNRVSEQELETVKADFIKKFAEMPSVKRTFLEYTLSSISHEKIKTSMEAFLHLSFFSNVGLSLDGNRLKVILPPMGLIIDLFRAASSYNKDAKFDLMFGHKNDYKLLDGRRPITMASLLFKTSFPHGYTEGSERLSMLFHDLVHVLLEFNNPHLKLLIKIGNDLLKESEQHPIFHSNPTLKKVFRSFAGTILDRGTGDYVHVAPEIAFHAFINKHLTKLSKKILKMDGANYLFHMAHVNEILLSVLGKNLLTSSSP